MLSTLLGSCVAVCLFDPVAGVMGMNHFLLPARHPGAGTARLESDEGRFGLWAMELLVNGVIKMGGRRERLRAKAFGGGNVLQTAVAWRAGQVAIGTANAAFVRQFLEQDGIPLIAQDLGGEVGRQIHFYGGDYSVYLRRIPRMETTRIVEQERDYLQQAIRSRDQVVPTEFF